MSLYLQKRGSIYYYRRRVPSAQKRFCVSLKTNDYQHALRLAACYDDYFCQIFRTMKIDPKNIRALKKIIKPNGDVEVEASIEEINAMSPEMAAVVFSSPAQSKPVNNYPTISQAILDYFIHRTTVDKVQDGKFNTCFSRLDELFGQKKIDELTYDDAKSILKRLEQMPANTAKFRNMKMDAIIAAYTGNEYFTNKNINNYIDRFSAFYEHLKTVHGITTNPFSSLRQSESKTPSRRNKVNFTDADLKLIFGSPRFSLHDYDHNYQFWTPLIALYTGARRAEIAQLHKKDIRFLDGYWVFDINDLDLGKKLKNPAARRITPIHPELIDIGFMEFVKSIPTDETRLFHEIETWTQKEGWGRPVGSSFIEYIGSLGVANDKVFHSFRGTFASALYAKGVDTLTRYRLSGRSEKTETVEERHYLELTIKHLYDKLTLVSFGDNVGHLKWPMP